jgi:hypothetical protein
VLIFFIAGLLFAPRARRSLGAYRIPLETGLLIPADKRAISNDAGPVKSVFSSLLTNPITLLRRRTNCVFFCRFRSSLSP